MYGRRSQRKRGLRRAVVTLLALVLLVSVCFPGLRASAEDGINVAPGGSVTLDADYSKYYSVKRDGTSTDALTVADADGKALVTAAATAEAGDYTITFTYGEDPGVVYDSSVTVTVKSAVATVAETEATEEATEAATEETTEPAAEETVATEESTEDVAEETESEAEQESTNDGISLTAENGPGGNKPSGGDQSTSYTTSPYSGHIDVRVTTGEYEFTQTVDTSSISSITVNKVWTDTDNVDHSGDSVTVYLKDSDGDKIGDVTLDASTYWTSKLSSLSLEEGMYYITEGDVTGYTASITNNGVIDLSGTSTSTEEYTVKVSSLTVTGMGSTLTYTHGGETYTVNYSNMTSDKGVDGLTVAEYSYKNSSGSDNGVYLENGDKITITVSYTVSYVIYDSNETPIKTVTDEVHSNETYVETVAEHGTAYVGNWCSGGGYDFYILASELLADVITEDLTEVTITNTPSTIDIPVAKVWSDGNDKHSSDKITVTLSGNGITYSAELSASNDWTYTFEKLPEYDVSSGAENAEPIEYTVEEVAVSGYNSKVEYNDDGSVTITNTPSTTSITLDKVVTGNMGDYSKEFTFTISVNGTALSDTYTLSHNSPIETISDIPIGATVTITESGNDGYKFSAVVTDGNEDNVNATVTDYTVSFTVSATGNAVVVTNNKEAEIDTGVTLDSAPYIFLTVLALGGTVLLMKRRRVI